MREDGSLETLTEIDALLRQAKSEPVVLYVAWDNTLTVDFARAVFTRESRRDGNSVNNVMSDDLISGEKDRWRACHVGELRDGSYFLNYWLAYARYLQLKAKRNKC